MKIETIFGMAQLATGAVAAAGVSTVVKVGVSKLLSPEMKPITKVMITIGGSALAGIGSGMAFNYIGERFGYAQQLLNGVSNGVKEGLKKAEADETPGEAKVETDTDDTKGK